MAKRTEWRITVKYLFPDGTPGTISSIIKGRKAAQIQATYDEGWVFAHGRTVVSTEIVEIKGETPC